MCHAYVDCVQHGFDIVHKARHTYPWKDMVHFIMYSVTLLEQGNNIPSDIPKW